MSIIFPNLQRFLIRSETQLYAIDNILEIKYRFTCRKMLQSYEQVLVYITLK